MRRSLTVQEVQQIILSLANDLQLYTTEHSMKLFALGGTLLGAYRDGKMIAWDDDLDVGLLREDYEFLKAHYQPIGTNMRLIYETDSDSYTPYLRLVDTVTISDSDFYHIPHGVFIDIFPIDQIEVSRSLFLKQKVLNIGRNIARSTGVLPGNAQLKMVKQLMFPIISHTSPHKWALWQGKWASRNINGQQAGVINGMHGEKEFIDITEWKNAVIVSLNGIKLFAPQHTENYLEKLYGADWHVPKKQIEKGHAMFYKK